MKFSKSNSFQVTSDLLIMEVSKKKSQQIAITHLTMGKDTPVTHQVVAKEKVAE